jgi:hypothetical protein
MGGENFIRAIIYEPRTKNNELFNRVPIMTREFITMTGQGTTSTFVESPLQINFFMQNKPNSPETKMNLSSVKAKCYEQKPPLRPPAKQTQFKPNQTQFKSQKKTLPLRCQYLRHSGTNKKCFVVSL